MTRRGRTVLPLNTEMTHGPEDGKHACDSNIAFDRCCCCCCCRGLELMLMLMIAAAVGLELLLLLLPRVGADADADETAAARLELMLLMLPPYFQRDPSHSQGFGVMMCVRDMLSCSHFKTYTGR